MPDIRGRLTPDDVRIDGLPLYPRSVTTPPLAFPEHRAVWQDKVNRLGDFAVATLCPAAGIRPEQVVVRDLVTPRLAPPEGASPRTWLPLWQHEGRANQVIVLFGAIAFWPSLEQLRIFRGARRGMVVAEPLVPGWARYTMRTTLSAAWGVEVDAAITLSPPAWFDQAMIFAPDDGFAVDARMDQPVAVEDAPAERRLMLLGLVAEQVGVTIASFGAWR